MLQRTEIRKSLDYFPGLTQVELDALYEIDRRWQGGEKMPTYMCLYAYTSCVAGQCHLFNSEAFPELSKTNAFGRLSKASIRRMENRLPPSIRVLFTSIFDDRAAKKYLHTILH